MSRDSPLGKTSSTVAETESRGATWQMLFYLGVDALRKSFEVKWQTTVTKCISGTMVISYNCPQVLVSCIRRISSRAEVLL